MKLFLFNILAVCLVPLLLSHVVVQAGPPIPSSANSFSIGPEDAKIHLDGFFDLMCPNCRSAWPGISGMMKELEGSRKVKFTLHLFPLPYHNNAFMVAQVATAFGTRNSSLAFEWMEAIYEDQELLGNDATDQLSTAQVRDAITKVAEKAQMDVNLARKALTDPTANGNTRVSWKYACFRGVFGTPTFFVNNVPAPEEAGSWSKKEWLSYIDHLLETSSII